MSWSRACRWRNPRRLCKLLTLWLIPATRLSRICPVNSFSKSTKSTWSNWSQRGVIQITVVANLIAYYICANFSRCRSSTRPLVRNLRQLGDGTNRWVRWDEVKIPSSVTTSTNSGKVTWRVDLKQWRQLSARMTDVESTCLSVLIFFIF